MDGAWSHGQHLNKGLRYSTEEQAAAIRKVRKLRAELGTKQGTTSRVAEQLNYGVETLRSRVGQANVADCVKAGVATDAQARMHELEQEMREFKRANEILMRAVSFLRGGARPPTPGLVRSINENKDDIVAGRRLGVGRICCLLLVGPYTYYAANGRPASARSVRDAEIAPWLLDFSESNYSVCGLRKLWKIAQREGIDIGRDKVARLINIIEVTGVRREKRFKPT